MRKTSTLLLVGIVAAFFVLIDFGYASWQKSAAQTELNTLNNNVKDLSARVLQYQNDRVLEAVSAKKAIESLKVGDVAWSKVIRDIRQVLPKDEKGNDIVEVSAYSGSRGSELSLNFKTMTGSVNPFLDVAKVIATFDQSKNFTNNFVPSIGIGSGNVGGMVLTFSMSTTYVKDDAEQLIKDQSQPETQQKAAVSETQPVKAQATSRVR